MHVAPALLDVVRAVVRLPFKSSQSCEGLLEARTICTFNSVAGADISNNRMRKFTYEKKTVIDRWLVDYAMNNVKGTKIAVRYLGTWVSPGPLLVAVTKNTTNTLHH